MAENFVGGLRKSTIKYKTEKKNRFLHKAYIPRSPKASDQSTVNKPQEMNQSMKLTTSDEEKIIKRRAQKIYHAKNQIQKKIKSLIERCTPR